MLHWGKSELSLLSGNGCMVKNNGDVTGRAYDMELAKLDLSDAINPVLSFNYAYGYEKGQHDGLAILISDDCGETYHSVFQKSGPSLKTAYADPDRPYTPKDNEWGLRTITLSSYRKEVLIKFRATSDDGNNLFIDNILIADNNETCPAPTDLDEAQITSSSAKLSWKFQGNASHFDIYYRPWNTFTWSQKTVAGNKQWVNISGLFPDTDYEWYMTATCNSNNSSASASSAFTTETSALQSADYLRTEEIKNLPGNHLKIFPNPVSSTAQISFSVSEPGEVSLDLYDITGRLVTKLADRNYIEGNYQINLVTKNLNSGIYILRMQTSSEIQTRKLIVVK